MSLQSWVHVAAGRGSGSSELQQRGATGSNTAGAWWSRDGGVEEEFGIYDLARRRWRSVEEELGFYFAPCCVLCEGLKTLLSPPALVACNSGKFYLVIV